MSRRLPPLNSLRVFEAAARHLSFTRAAEELFVTQAAVSHQIKALEEFLSLKLFRRRNRSLLLTEEGQSYFLDIKDIFTSLAEATDKVLELQRRCLRSSTRGNLWAAVAVRDDLDHSPVGINGGTRIRFEPEILKVRHR